MIESGKTIFQNTVVLSAAEVLTRLLSLALIMVVGRKLGPELMGVYAFGLAFIGIFQIFANFGLEPYIQREVSRQPEISGQLLAQIFVLKLIIFIACVAVIIIFSLSAVADPLKRQVIWILTGTMFFQVNVTATNAFFRAHQKSIYEAVVRMMMRVIYTLAGIAALYSGRGLLTLVSLELAAQLCACIFAWNIFNKYIGNPIQRVTLNRITALVRATWEFFLIRLFQTIFNSVDLVMLSLMAGDIPTGYYSVTVRLIGAFGFLPTAFTGAFFPELSRKSLEGSDAFSSIFKPYYRFLLLTGIGIGAVIAGLSERFIVLLFGAEFQPAAPTLALMAVALILIFANWPLSTAIIAINKERQSLWIFSICAGTNIILNLGLIPLMKDQGAALATVLSQILLMILQLRVMGYELLKRIQLIRLSSGPVIAGVLTWLIIRFADAYHTGLVWMLALALLGFTLSAIVTRALKIEDLMLGKKYLFER